MENEMNPKPQETGGLKLMTVFIGVLALHVVVIGGFTVYHLMSGGSTDADLVTDKNHKTVKVTPENASASDTATTDTAGADKSTTASPAPADTTSGTPVTIPAPADTTAATATAQNTAPAPIVPPPSVQNPPSPSTASGPVTTSVSAPEPSASAPSGPIQSGPVITPANPPPDVADQSAAPAPGNSQSDSSSAATYTVRAHDTLARIAHRNHLKMAALRSANGLTSDKLHLGEKLIIPAPNETTSALASEPAASNDSHGPDRTLLGDSPSLSRSVSSTPHDRATMAAAGSSRHTYVVTKGDTLIRIAHRFHTTSNALMALNNISDPRKLRLGQKLRIPSGESRSATSAPPANTPPTAPSDRIEPRATPSAQLANFIN